MLDISYSISVLVFSIPTYRMEGDQDKNMSARKCAREECGKTVYPLEELKCLDKVWHKQCFKCTVCGMTLNMKNYKGYDKMPYCEPHYPKTVASVVTDTPEMRRVAENTRNQSQVQYHAAYEKSKGTKIDVADDPEMERHRKNMQAQSQIAYTGELDKRKKMEEVRPNFVPAEGSGKEKTPPPANAPVVKTPPANAPVGTEKTSPVKAPVGKEKTPPAKAPAAKTAAKAGGHAPAATAKK
ncbi:hypothetical protein Y032_0564g3536 [Ancylostoma ceylanicum]|uniref:LIM zinc-binding domain-containing protein n=1 Tax=Ancylostoma ceylanicum TaxID=53326 RepID=A0A016WP55_9BILA|nr:hypothetical protein Y032_0564g3536 [Ancylostoma ceylanicum]